MKSLWGFLILVKYAHVPSKVFCCTSGSTSVAADGGVAICLLACGKKKDFKNERKYGGNEEAKGEIGCTPKSI